MLKLLSILLFTALAVWPNIANAQEIHVVDMSFYSMGADCTTACSGGHPLVAAVRDTGCIQEALDTAAAPGIYPGERQIIVPAGTCSILATLHLDSASGVDFGGAGVSGTVIEWSSIGPANSDLFSIEDCRFCTFHDFTTRVEAGESLLKVFDIRDNSNAASVTSSRNSFFRLELVGGAPYGDFDIGFHVSEQYQVDPLCTDDEPGDPPCAKIAQPNSEYFQWRDVRVAYYKMRGWYFESTQNKSMSLIDCECHGDTAAGTACVESEGSFTAINMTGGRNEVDFLVVSTDPTTIIGANMEQSLAFIDAGTWSTAPNHLTVQGSRWAADAVGTSGTTTVVSYGGRGAFEFTGNYIGYGGDTKPLEIYLGGTVDSMHLFESNTFGSTLSDDAFWAGRYPKIQTNNIRCTNASTCAPIGAKITAVITGDDLGTATEGDHNIAYVSSDITTLQGAYKGHRLTLIATTAVTIDDSTCSDCFVLSGNTDFSMDADDTLSLLYLGDRWVETGRSDN